jgi:hypothetical protein
MQPGNQGQDPYGQQPPSGDQPPQPPQYGQPPSDPYAQQYPSAPGYPETYGAPPSQPSNTMGLVAMILGIVSLPLVCCFAIGVPLGLASAIVGFLGKRKADQGLATNGGQALTGLICGGIAFVGGIILITIGQVADLPTEP